MPDALALSQRIRKNAAKHKNNLAFLIYSLELNDNI
jgi:hypothetical protein